MDKKQDFFENKMWLKVRPHWYLHPTLGEIQDSGHLFEWLAWILHIILYFMPILS